MSAAPSLASPTAPLQRSARSLRAVTPARRRRPRVAYALVAVAGALAIGATQMALSILTTQMTYEMSHLATEQRQLAWQTQIIHEDVAGMSSPQFLAANATAMGMIINESPSYLRLSDGQVRGTVAPAVGATSVDALGRAAVMNSLVADTPLVTAPGTTLQGPTAGAANADADASPGMTGPIDSPPALEQGLPTPNTH